MEYRLKNKKDEFLGFPYFTGNPRNSLYVALSRSDRRNPRHCKLQGIRTLAPSKSASDIDDANNLFALPADKI